MRVAFVVPAVHRVEFSAGMLSILTYARGLSERGHEVWVVPLGFGVRPDWFELPDHLIVEHAPRPRSALRALSRATAALVRNRLGGGSPTAVSEALSHVVRQLAPFADRDALRRGVEFDRMRRVAPDCDLTIATGAPTVAPVYVHGKGTLVHFMQHYEVLFTDAFEDTALAHEEAVLAHRLPMQRIANVSWVAERVARETGAAVPVCWAGLDHSAFHPDGRPPEEPFTVVTYGGRGISWKGFEDAARAVRLARREIGDLRWRVYGGASLPPDNPVAPYEDEGFVSGVALRRLYSTAHVTLLPSWREGFPFPPLEAMACGSAVIATPLGATDVAVDGENALLVPPEEPEAIARALVALWRDPARREQLVAGGLETARRFSWEESIERFEKLLHEALAAPEQAPVTGRGLASPRSD